MADEVVRELTPQESLMKDMMEMMKETQKQNQELRELLAKKENNGFADGVPRNLRSDDLSVIPEDSRFARRVVLHTRAADPEYIRRELPHTSGLVDPGALSTNPNPNPRPKGE